MLVDSRSDLESDPELANNIRKSGHMSAGYLGRRTAECFHLIVGINACAMAIVTSRGRFFCSLNMGLPNRYNRINHQDAVAHCIIHLQNLGDLCFMYFVCFFLFLGGGY